jgi:acetylornithine deacetylase/succinyl-diaminopimelate desuccinylase-like protein
LSCDDNDKIARDRFAGEVKKLGADYTVDAMGCQWATIEGDNNEIPPIGIGSHLDSVQTGGKFDGPLGANLVDSFRRLSLICSTRYSLDWRYSRF